MSVTHLTLERFGPFGRAEFPLCSGVNVFLGANSTGKTFAAKALYAVLKGLGPEARLGATPREQVRDKLAGVFRPDDGEIRRLVSRTHGKSTGRIAIAFDDDSAIRTTISTAARQPIASLRFVTEDDLGSGSGEGESFDLEEMPVLFLPSREVLSMFEGFIGAYERRELSFDETYYDAVVALDTPALRGPRPGLLRDVVERLEREIGGKIRHEGPRFYLHERRGRLEAHLMAEGLRKVASIVHLIANGALRQGGMLIWDEPEANLHPRLAEVVVECLGALADGGVQVVVCTHDYLIADAISRWAQYREVSDWSAPVRFFQLLREEDDDVRVDVADTFVDLPVNPLLDAFLDHHDREQDLIARRLTRPVQRRRRT